jgi:hypothetical protein
MVIDTRLARLAEDTARLLTDVVSARSSANSLTGEKADYRAIGRRLEYALVQINKALERANDE